MLKDKSSRILFVIPRVKSLFGDDYARPGHPHIGIAYLSSFLKQKGISVAIFDAGVDRNNEVLAKLINNFEPELIGVTAFSYCFHLAEELIQTVRSYSRIPVVMGGPHVSAAGKEVMENKSIDFAVRGEGEFALLELINAVHNDEHDFGKIR